jgi:PIN domain nuclease of toxin-antitoxin system
VPRLLLDTHIVLALLRRNFDQQFPNISKLETGIPLPDIPANLSSGSLEILGINVSHVLHTLDPEPHTRDPFDRLLLAQCHVEGLRLVTVDRALVDHPMAFRP